jgi:hypothetical protein
MTGNHVSNANDALSANHSQGTTFTNNTVTTSLSGLHTDNAGDSGGVADTISGNTVSCTPGSGAYGVWAFVPYKTPTISNNVVSGCDVGLAALASCNLDGTNNCPGGTVPAVQFTGNSVTTTASAGSLGLYVTTNSFGFGDGEVRANGDHNVISGPGKSVFVEETGGEQATVHVNRNSLLSAQNAGATAVDGKCNWWGQASGPGVGQVTGSVTTNPFLGSSNLDGACPPIAAQSAPGAPRGVNAVPRNHGAVVRWTAPASNGGAAIDSYVVKAVTNGTVQAVQTFGGSATSGSIPGLVNGTPYRFRVIAHNAVGNGSAAVTTTTTTAGAPGAPTQPTVTHPAAGSLQLTFKAPATNGAPIKSYAAVCVSPHGVNGTKTGNTKTLVVSGLTVGKVYRCRVTATNSRGTGPLSAPSAPTTA